MGVGASVRHPGDQGGLGADDHQVRFHRVGQVGQHPHVVPVAAAGPGDGCLAPA